MNSSVHGNEMEDSSSANHKTIVVASLEAESLVKMPKSRRMYIFVAILIPILVAYLFRENLALLTTR